MTWRRKKGSLLYYIKNEGVTFIETKSIEDFAVVKTLILPPDRVNDERCVVFGQLHRLSECQSPAIKKPLNGGRICAAGQDHKVHIFSGSGFCS